MLTREEIIERERARPKVERIENLPVWGGEIYVRRLSGAERDRWDMWNLAHSYDEDDEKEGRGRAGMFRDDAPAHVRARFVVLVACDAEGQPLFAEEDVAMVAGFDHEPLQVIWERGRAFNGLGKGAEEQAGKNCCAASATGGSA